jgi:signal transduction histidine kinase
LLSERIDHPEFRASLTKTMTESVNRIGRLAHQMLYLARDTVAFDETIPVPQLLDEAFAEAQLHHLSSPGRMLPTISQGTPSIPGDHKALKHALAEILLNALQANPADPVARVKVSHDYDQQGRPWLHIEVEDAGSGFTEDTAQKATQPFFSTRTVGLGLGLTVARKILQAHRGTLTITEAAKQGHGVVSLHLPLTSPSLKGSPSQNP